MAALVPCLGALLVVPTAAAAQQFVTDDAYITEVGSCQLEAWHGEASSWVLPACRVPGAALELQAGVGFIPEHGRRHAEYVVQAKLQLREPRNGTPGFGLAGGVGHDPQAQVAGGLVAVFAHVPVTVVFANSVEVHANVGWHFEYEDHDHHGHSHDEGGHHAVTWAVRTDVGVPRTADRVLLVGELFGENRISPAFQVGARSVLLPDRLMIDVSWGGHTARGVAGTGWTAGFTWTPPPLF